MTEFRKGNGKQSKKVGCPLTAVLWPCGMSLEVTSLWPSWRHCMSPSSGRFAFRLTQLHFWTLLSWSGPPSFGALSSANKGHQSVTPHLVSEIHTATPPSQLGHRQTMVLTVQMPTRAPFPHQPSFVGAAEANTKAHFVAEAVPRGTTLFQ